MEHTYYLYEVKNTMDNTIYIGKTNNIKRRWRTHRNNSENILLNRAIKKYGYEHFSFRVIKSFYSEEECYNQEKILIEQLRNSGENLYNIAEGGKGIFSGTNHYLYGKHHSDESKRKMSESHKGKILTQEHKNKISQSCKGNFHTEEIKNKISNSKIGKKLTQEHKNKIGISSKGRIHNKKTKQILSECNKGENNNSCILSDNDVKNILTLWFSIEFQQRNKLGYKKKFYDENIKNNYPIKIITLYEYLSGKKRKDIFNLFHSA